VVIRSDSSYRRFAVTLDPVSARTTAGLDVINVAAIASRNRLLEAGGEGASLNEDFACLELVLIAWGCLIRPEAGSYL
jgi:hypothetical protein